MARKVKPISIPLWDESAPAPQPQPQQPQPRAEPKPTPIPPTADKLPVEPVGGFTPRTEVSRLVPAPKRNVALEGPPDLPEGFHLRADERVVVCPKCGEWSVAQERPPTREHPRGHIAYSHGVQGRVTGYREIIAICHCIVYGSFPEDDTAEVDAEC